MKGTMESTAITRELRELAALADTVAAELREEIAAIARLYLDVLASGGTLYFAGNGGSAADAQHIAAEYVVRFGRSRGALPAVAITTDTSVLTACGNDFSFEDVFARQVEALCGEGDLLVLHSTSGKSENLLRAAASARRRGTKTVALLGRDGGLLRPAVDLAVVVPSESTSHIQELHMAIEHIVCGLVEQSLPAER